MAKRATGLSATMLRHRGSIRAAVVLGAVVLGAAFREGTPMTATLAVTPAGPEETVFRWRDDRCAHDHIPDAPARAVRTSSGEVLLFATHDTNRAMVGLSLDHLRFDCRIRYQGTNADDPAAYDDRTWIASVHSEDGVVVDALGHMEYQGHRRPEVCPAGSYMRCWRNAIVALRSTDGGRSFAPSEAGNGSAVVAALPYPFEGEQPSRTGYFNPSNMVTHAGHTYAFIFAERTGAQERGACLIRTDRIDDPSAWRAWNGKAFAVRFADPYRERVDLPENHVCAPLKGLPFTVSSVVRHLPTGLFVAVMSGARPAAGEGARDVGIFFATSADMIHWSRPDLVVMLPLMWAFDCGSDAVYAYPSLLDPASDSRTFATVGDEAFLYLTRFNVRGGCRLPMDRDLVRLPVTLTLTAAP